MNKFSYFIYLILFVKFAFVLMSITHIYLKIKGKENSDLDNLIVYWKHRCEFIFIFLMSFLLIYLFNPRKPTVVIDFETKILLFLFGFVLLLTAKWDLFFHEAKWFTYIQQSVGKE
jgi:hypothetical protein